MLTIRARSYENGEPIQITLRGDRIRSVEPAWPKGAVNDWPFVAPGLFDLQINGHSGVWFSDEALTADDVLKALAPYPQFGVTRLCPTLITNSFEGLAAGFAAIRAACECEPWADRMVCGCHLEGPYISPEDGPRGAHPRRHVRPPDWDEFRRFQEASGGRIRLVTLAPEHDGALPFIEKLTASGVVVAIGHTAATGARIRDAVRAGARLSTHLGNGCSAMLPRHDNPIWEQLAADDLWASVICDGWHLTPAVARCILRVKTPARAVLTCDASSLAGLPPGRYAEWGEEFEVLPSGNVVTPGTSYLAGSGVFTDTCVGWAARHAGVSLRDAVDMASARPRELLGLPNELTDLVLFDYEPGGEFRVTGVVAA